MVPLSTKGAKSLPLAENLKKLFNGIGGKFKFSAQVSDLAPFVGNGTKVKIPSEINPTLATYLIMKYDFNKTSAVHGL